MVVSDAGLWLGLAQYMLVISAAQSLARPFSWGISHWMESPIHLPELLWLTPGWVATQMHTRFKNNTILKSRRLWENEKENFPQWDNDRAGHLTGGWRNLRLLWTRLPPQKPFAVFTGTISGLRSWGKQLSLGFQTILEKKYFPKDLLHLWWLPLGRKMALPVKSTTSNW